MPASLLGLLRLRGARDVCLPCRRRAAEQMSVLPGIPLADPVNETYLDGWERDVLLGGRMSAFLTAVVYNTIGTLRHMKACDIGLEETTPPTAGALEMRA
jgi:hypothetical protein